MEDDDLKQAMGEAAADLGVDLDLPPSSAPAPASASAVVSDPSPGGAGEQPSSPPAAPPSTQMRDWLAQRDWQVGHLESDEDVNRELTQLVAMAQHAQELKQRVDELNSLAPYGQKYRDHQSQFEKWWASQQKSDSPAAKTTPEKQGGVDWTKPPEFNPQWSSYVRFDPQYRRFVLNDAGKQIGAPQQWADKATEYHEWREQRHGQLLENFPDLVQQIVSPLLPKTDNYVTADRLGELVEQHLAKRNDERSFTQFVEENAKHFFVTDQRGQVVSDPISGQPILTPLGTRMSHHAAELRRSGLDETKVRMYALAAATEEQRQVMQQAGGGGASPQSGASPQGRSRDASGRLLSAEEKNEQHKASFLQNARQRGEAAPRPASKSGGSVISKAASDKRFRDSDLMSELLDETLAELGSG